MSRWGQQPGRPPVKVVFDGVPHGSPLARELYAQLHGAISQFHRKALQAYLAGELDNHFTHQALPGGAGRVRYSNVGGQETLFVTVAKDLVTHAMKQANPYPLWNWALVEFFVPSTDYVAEALLRPLGQSDPAPGTMLPYPHMATNADDGAGTDNIVMYSRPSQAVATRSAASTGDNNTGYYISFSVNLAGFGPQEQVPFESRFDYIDSVLGSYSLQYYVGDVYPSGSSPAAAGDTPVDEYLDFFNFGETTTWYQHYTGEYPPGVHFDTSLGIYTLASGAVLSGPEFLWTDYTGWFPAPSPATPGETVHGGYSIDRYGVVIPGILQDLTTGAVTVCTPDTAVGPVTTGEDHYLYWRIVTNSPETHGYTGDGSVTVRARMFRENPRLQVGLYNTNPAGQFPRWEFTGTAPARPALDDLGTHIAGISTDGGPDNTALQWVQQLDRFGTIIFDRKIGAALFNYDR